MVCIDERMGMGMHVCSLVGIIFIYYVCMYVCILCRFCQHPPSKTKKKKGGGMCVCVSFVDLDRFNGMAWHDRVY